jgi:hypothetical protein
MLSLRALPMLAIPLILYNALALSGGQELLDRTLFTMPMLKGGSWRFTTGDLILLITILTFFVEIIKSTFTGSAAILDHALSMVLFIVAGLEFLIVPQAATSIFFFIVLLCLIDVIAGYTIGMRAARRDISFGGQDN